MSTATAAPFSIQDFLRNESQKDLLRFSTAGSVDDGKSTLIGRLLYDTQSVYEDQVRAIEGKGTTAPGQIDFALLTDGLRAEREQGITIDVAYRYFSTSKRKFIIADTPGHEQYTRNMATGASTADAAVVLIDATKGVLPQSRRHAFIASLLRVSHVVVAVNKMDLAGYSEETFRAIQKDFSDVLGQIAADTGTAVNVLFIPVSALAGDNVVHRSETMTWYSGPSLLETLEQLPATQGAEGLPFRFPVQRVVRPDHTFRGFAGQIASGKVRAGDEIVVLPSGSKATVKRIVTWDGDMAEATAPLSVTLVLDREVDISRGDVISEAPKPAALGHHLTTSLVWMDAKPLQLNHRYLVKHASHTVPAFVTAIDHRTNITTLAHEEAATLEMNHIGQVKLNLLRPIAFDPYLENRGTGALILIDPLTNGTIAAGMIKAGEIVAPISQFEEDDWGPVTAGERQSRWGHRGTFIELTGPQILIDAVERSLFSVGAVTSRLEADNDDFLLHPGLLDAIVRLQTQSGILSLIVHETEGDALLARTESDQVEVEATEPQHVVAAVHQLLYRSGIFISSEKGKPLMSPTDFEIELKDKLDRVRAVLAENVTGKGDVCLTCSFQAEDVLLTKLALELDPRIPILFLDTGYHFAETYMYRDQIASDWKLNLFNLLPELTVAEQEGQFGILNQTAPDQCCKMRKVEPLFKALADYRVWLTGLRREQAKSRAALEESAPFTLPGGVQILKLAPLAEWTTKDVWYACDQLAIPLLPLYERGYSSIGCEPCTLLPLDPNDPRSGRWAGRKVECGIHIEASR